MASILSIRTAWSGTLGTQSTTPAVQLATGGKRLGAGKTGAGGRNRDIGGGYQLRFLWVELADIDHQDAVGWKGRDDRGALTQVGMRKPGADRHWHAAQHA